MTEEHIIQNNIRKYLRSKVGSGSLPAYSVADGRHSQRVCEVQAAESVV